MKNINFALPDVGSLEIKNCLNALKSGWISKGDYVNLFEKKFAKILGSKYAVSVNNGTNAFLLILMHLKVKPGDEIIVPSFCYVSPIHMIKLLGAIPVVADVDINTFQIDPKKIIKKISKKTKAILVIHNYGGLCDIVSIQNIANRFRINIVEDFSETTFSQFNNKYIGSGFWQGKNFNLLSFSSMHATKTITSGEGGVITTNSLSNYENLCNLRDHGISNNKAYFYRQLGGNFRLSNILAAIAYAQVSRYKEIISKKKKILIEYIKLFYNIKYLAIQKFNNTKYPKKTLSTILWGFAIRIKKYNRVKKIINGINKETIIARPGFCSLHRLNYLKILKNKRNKKSDFKNSSILEKSIIVLPAHIKLKSSQIKFIFKKINYLFYNQKINY